MLSLKIEKLEWVEILSGASYIICGAQYKMIKQEPGWRWRRQCCLPKGLLPQPTADVWPSSGFNFHAEKFSVPGLWVRGPFEWPAECAVELPALHDGVGHAPDPCPIPPRPQPGAEGNGKSVGPHLQLLAALASGQDWQGVYAWGLGYQAVRISGQEPVPGRQWDGRLTVSSGLIPFPIGLHLQTMTSKIKLLRISHSHSIKPQAGSPPATVLVTCLWSQPWFWVTPVEEFNFIPV